jgi:DNA topoisomerase-1
MFFETQRRSQMFRLSQGDFETYRCAMARLRRSRPDAEGLRRVKRGRGFAYVDAAGRPAHNDDLERIAALVIPPAWTDVWICADPFGHLQATGIDAAGRRQYVYHAQWRAHRDRAKFAGMLTFAQALASARPRINAALDRGDLDHEHVSALCVWLLDQGLFRVGGETYAQDNGTHGLATLKREHAVVRGNDVAFSYTAKGGIAREITITDARCARAISTMKRRRDPRDDLMAWRVSKNSARWHDVTSADINEAVSQWVHPEATAKTFRTWHGTVIAAAVLADSPPASSLSKTARTHVVAGAMRAVAAALGNTPAVARASYVDPRVIDLWENGTVIGSRAVPEADSLLPAHVEDSEQQRLERAVCRLLADA